ncbi:MAG: tRNA lysidine(34) synthetase TilS [Gammaproteobacteria bacterium]|nr:tRNA lysidine(34) synthetase TilS [Gammaproteobacteria bacterium]
MSFSSETLLATLQDLPTPTGYCVALSGGLDSTVLLHAMAVLRESLSVPLRALHIDHGIDADSARWGDHCAALCADLAIPLDCLRVTLHERKAQGLEASARQARYAAFDEALDAGEMLLSAHHRDDQTETLLLQLLRGGGVHGMAGMPLVRQLGQAYLARPLLGVARAELLAYAQSQGLRWIEDPSNLDTRLERNYLRHRLIPQLEQRRAGQAKVLARSAAHFAENAELLDELAAVDLAACADGEALMIPALLRRSPARQRNLLRFFVRQAGLPLPDHRRLQAILDDLLPAAADAEPRVSWPGAELRRYRDRLYAMPPLPALPEAGWQQEWDGQEVLRLPGGLGDYRLLPQQGGLAPSCLQGQVLTIRLRGGGERLRLPGHAHHASLKTLFQQRGIPPWQRARVPLLYLDGVLAQVAGFWTEAAFAVAQGERGYMLRGMDTQ